MKTARSLDEILESMGTMVKAKVIEPQPLTNKPTPSLVVSEPKPHPLVLAEDWDGKERVAKILAFCWKTLHLYGKKPEDYDDIAETYLMRLANYPVAEIEQAFSKYLDNRTEFPAPASIIGILQGRIKRDASYYNKLQRKIKEGFLTPDESNYVKRYEQQLLEDWE